MLRFLARRLLLTIPVLLGVATLVFSGGAAIRLELECIEVRLKDLGPVWEADGRPDHEAVRNLVENRP